VLEIFLVAAMPIHHQLQRFAFFNWNRTSVKPFAAGPAFAVAAVSWQQLLLQNICPCGRLELEGVGGERRIGLHAGKADQ
jgi:hypothetical protein